MSPEPEKNFLDGIDLSTFESGETVKSEKPATRSEYGSDLTVGMIIVDEVHDHTGAGFISGNGPQELLAALTGMHEHITYKRLEILDIRSAGGVNSCKCVDLATLQQEPAYVADVQQVDVLIV